MPRQTCVPLTAKRHPFGLTEHCNTQVADARAEILLRLTPARLALAAALFWLLLFGGIAATLWLLRRQPLLEQASGLEALRKDLDTATAAYVLVERQVLDTQAGQRRTADR